MDLNYSAKANSLFKFITPAKAGGNSTKKT